MFSFIGRWRKSLDKVDKSTISTLIFIIVSIFGYTMSFLNKIYNLSLIFNIIIFIILVLCVGISLHKVWSS